MICRYFLLVICLLILPNLQGRQPTDEVAIVNSFPILYKELEQRMSLGVSKEVALELLIEERLLVNARDVIQSADIGITDSVVIMEIAKQKTEGTYTDRVGELSELQYQQVLKEKLQLDKWLNGEHVPAASDLLEGVKNLRPVAFSAKQILTEDESSAEEATAMLKAGKDFYEVHKQFASNVGSDIIISSMMFPELNEVSQESVVGKIIGPVKTASGFRVFVLNNIQSIEYDPLTTMLLAQNMWLQTAKSNHKFERINQLKKTQNVIYLLND